MAFTPTVLQEAILETQRSAGYGISENERRLSKYGALEAHRAGTERLIPASTLAMMKEATSQATSIDVFQRVAPGAGTTRACEGAGTGTTVNVPLTYNGFREEFKLSWIEHEGNRTKYQEAFNYMFAEKLRNLYSRIDIAAVANLEANKATGAGAGSIYAADLGDADAKAVPLADHSNFFNNAMVEMMENDFNGPFFNVSTTGQVALQRFDAQQGANNDTNLSWMQNDYIHYPTNRFAAGAGNISASYLFDPSAVGMITWTNQLSRVGKDIGGDEWTAFSDPLGLLGSLELKVKKQCEDNSGSFAGAEADYTESFVMFVEVAFVTAYDSVLGAPIFKYLLKDA
jgi:hypothetical protein